MCINSCPVARSRLCIGIPWHDSDYCAHASRSQQEKDRERDREKEGTGILTQHAPSCIVMIMYLNVNRPGARIYVHTFARARVAFCCAHTWAIWHGSFAGERCWTDARGNGLANARRTCRYMRDARRRGEKEPLVEAVITGWSYYLTVMFSTIYLVILRTLS